MCTREERAPRPHITSQSITACQPADRVQDECGKIPHPCHSIPCRQAGCCSRATACATEAKEGVEMRLSLSGMREGKTERTADKTKHADWACGVAVTNRGGYHSQIGRQTDRQTYTPQLHMHALIAGRQAGRHRTYASHRKQKAKKGGQT